GYDFQGVPEEAAWRAARAAEHLLPLDEESWQLKLVWEEVATALEGEQLANEGAAPDLLDAWSEQSVESGRTMGWTATNFDAIIADTLREVVGPVSHFRVSIGQAILLWNDSTILKLAQAIYEERAFDHLPILADALEESGCNNTDILSHCRGPGPHVRG